jgi:hypothetical protein
MTHNIEGRVVGVMMLQHGVIVRSVVARQESPSSHVAVVFVGRVKNVGMEKETVTCKTFTIILVIKIICSEEENRPGCSSP